LPQAPLAAWEALWGTSNDATGVIYRRSMVKMAHILDGASNTYLIGERFLNPDNYYDGYACDNDQGWDLGYDYDVNRWTGAPDQPLQDRPGLAGCRTNFGSAHAAGFQMALCDGSVHLMRFDIDPEIHRRLGNRKDKLPISQGF